jgi:hypothetical protein
MRERVFFHRKISSMYPFGVWLHKKSTGTEYPPGPSCIRRSLKHLQFCSGTPVSPQSYTFTSHSKGIRVSGAQENTPIRSELLLSKKALPPHRPNDKDYMYKIELRVCHARSYYSMVPLICD